MPNECRPLTHDEIIDVRDTACQGRRRLVVRARSEPVSRLRHRTWGRAVQAGDARRSAISRVAADASALTVFAVTLYVDALSAPAIWVLHEQQQQ